MSDYAKEKVVAYPLTEEVKKQLIEKFKLSDIYDLEYEESVAKYFKRNKLERAYANGYFDITGFCDYDGDGKCREYLVFVLQSSYDEDAGEYGKKRDLYPNEQVTYVNRFREVLGFTPEADKLKLLEYCWYNCSEPTDYYLNIDEFYEEI